MIYHAMSIVCAICQYFHICMHGKRASVFPIPISNRAKSWHFIELLPPAPINIIENFIKFHFIMVLIALDKNCINRVINLAIYLTVFSLARLLLGATCLFMCRLLLLFYFPLYCALFFCPNVQRSIARILYIFSVFFFSFLFVVNFSFFIYPAFLVEWFLMFLRFPLNLSITPAVFYRVLERRGRGNLPWGRFLNVWCESCAKS